MSVRGGYSPSSYDPRDIYDHSDDFVDASKVLLYRPAARNQGTVLDCCTSMAITTALEILDQQNGNGTELSPLFHYFYSRSDYRYFGGVTLRQALKTATKNGICRKELHDVAYTKEGALIRPSLTAIEDGLRQKIVPYDVSTRSAGYWRADGANRVNKWKSILNKGLPIIAGFWTQKSYWRGEGILKHELEAPLGPHAVCIVGFDEDKHYFIAFDSRGENFASDGEWPLSYEVTNSEQVVESWTVSKISSNP